LAGLRITVPGPRIIRLAVVASNLKIQRVMDAVVRPGDRVVDVGANIGYNTLYAARRTGPRGRVYAVEPAQDNLAVLYANVLANGLTNVTVLPFAAGRGHEVRDFFLRGEVSAVNSFFADNFYAAVTAAVQVPVAPLDDLIVGEVKLVKIDVEGAELEVLHGMARLLRARPLRLIVEWHPVLQAAAGFAHDELPRRLLAGGFALHAVTHTRVLPLVAEDVELLVQRLTRSRSPVDLLAAR
jgi:FkbM family methyltransferase